MARHGKTKARARRVPPFATPKAAASHRFTMQEEARNTETHHRLRDNGNLRSKAVQFVSVGELQRSEFENVERDSHSPAEKKAEAQTDCTTGQPEEEPESMFFFDSVGQSVADTGLPDPAPLADPVSSDDSSEDEVVFTGRNNSKPIVIETDQKDLQVLQDLQEPESLPQMEELTLRTHQSHPTHSRRKPPARQRHKWSPENDDMLADYIANMDQDYQIAEGNSRVQLELEGGIGVSYTTAESESSSFGSDDLRTRNVQNDAGYRKKQTGNNDETEVESSINVLSNMYLDTKPDPTVVSEKEDAELDTPDTSDLESDDDEEDLDTDLLEQLALEYSNKKKMKGHTGKHSFPSASAFADAIDADPYYGFDIMDFNRPSLLKPGRGKKPPALDLMLSDSDLEVHLQEVWQTDRKKKKTKKQEREELRSQGLLGRTPEDADLKVKYSKGMNMEELMTEIRTFLMSPKTSLSLPPMTKHRRKTIHELANVLNLKSQSRGNGLTRFPILLKTSRTPGYTRKTISKVDSLLSGRKLNRRLFQSWGADGPKPTKAKPKGVSSGVSYMDGDVVGASAPEIGAGNRGRAMLEKMGWSSGTALGANNNKGILQPVSHVVKNSRAGLG